jgi:hypothetical protein
MPESLMSESPMPKSPMPESLMSESPMPKSPMPESLMSESPMSDVPLDECVAAFRRATQRAFEQFSACTTVTYCQMFWATIGHYRCNHVWKHDCGGDVPCRHWDIPFWTPHEVWACMCDGEVQRTLLMKDPSMSDQLARLSAAKARSSSFTPDGGDVFAEYLTSFLSHNIDWRRCSSVPESAGTVEGVDTSRCSKIGRKALFVACSRTLTCNSSEEAAACICELPVTARIHSSSINFSSTIDWAAFWFGESVWNKLCGSPMFVSPHTFKFEFIMAPPPVIEDCRVASCSIEEAKEFLKVARN